VQKIIIDTNVLVSAFIQRIHTTIRFILNTFSEESFSEESIEYENFKEFYFE